MPGRGTLARRNGRAGPDGVVDDDEVERALRRATTRVPRKARLAHAAVVGTIRGGCCARRAWRRRYRARGPRPDGALTLGRARILRSVLQRRGNWRNAADAFGRQRNVGYRSTGRGNVPTGFGLRPGAKAPDEPPTPHRYAPPVDSTEVVRTRVRQLRGPHLSTCA